jgi:hypothetical protein
MKLINPALLRPQPIILIALITIATHIIAKPIYTAVDQSNGQS